MHDLRDELAVLVADVASALDALRLQGALVLPRGPASTLSPAPDAPSLRLEPPPRMTPRASAPVAAPPGAREARTPPPEAPPRSPTRATVPPVALAAPEAPGGGGLLGRWAEQLVGPDERLATAVAALGEACGGCGKPPVQGVGALRSGLVLLCDPCTVAETPVLSNMLLKVIGVEPGDVWTASPRECPECLSAVRRQVDAIKPRVILVLGATSAAATGLPRGEWSSFAGVAAIASWHPGEMAADSARKRPAFDVLQQVAKRR